MTQPTSPEASSDSGFLSNVPRYPGGGAPEPYQPIAPEPRSGTNGFAIASFALSLVGGLVLSVIFGIVALVQLKDRPQAGKGLAVAGLVISGVWIAGFAVLIVVLLNVSADRTPQGTLASPGRISVDDLRVGDCANGLQESQFVTSVDGVPCSSQHEGEVFAAFTLPAGTYPGADEVRRQAEDGCAWRFDVYASDAENLDGLELFYLYPSSSSWGRGSRTVTCVATDPTGGRIGSLRG
jgi:hypothetical protein